MSRNSPRVPHQHHMPCLPMSDEVVKCSMNIVGGKLGDTLDMTAQGYFSHGENIRYKCTELSASKTPCIYNP